MTDTPIDQAVFAELQDATGPEFAAELVTTFLDEAPGMIADLRDAATQGDEDRLRRAAHSIKSNANVFGATYLAEIARAIELEGLGGNSLSDLDAEYARMSAALKVLLDG
ncbi:Hpt domain-containing protein [Primorskyibacter sp. S87]|uniref:Hpt domain-containing protein n=1 Tax=Primorskyibacter sp. S87 TaxID=3415126 RepID=UPI003C799668